MKWVIMDKVISCLILTAYSTQFIKKKRQMVLCSLNLLTHCKVGYSFMSNSAVSETLRHAAYSCVPTCTGQHLPKQILVSPCNSTTPPEFLLYLWAGHTDYNLEFWCLVLNYVVLKCILCVFGWNLKAVPLLDLGGCKKYSQTVTLGSWCILIMCPWPIRMFEILTISLLSETQI